MVDKQFCMSSYLAFRYIEKEGVEFYEGLRHQMPHRLREEEFMQVVNAEDIDAGIRKQFDTLRGKRLGILLSGGMDSTILASYMRGCDAYTFRFLGGKFQQEELKRAEHFAAENGMTLHYVDINWEVVQKNLPVLMRRKGAPVHSIEPQILEGALQAKKDGIEMMIIGDASDYVFGGMDQLLSRDWKFDEFVKRYTYLSPQIILREPVDVNYLYERYRTGEDAIDWLRFLGDIAIDESYCSYSNAFAVAGMPYYDPYERFKMADPLDLGRIRKGESKYLIRDLFRMRYPHQPIPEKIPMPRPVDIYFKDWQGPIRPEFRSNIDMTALTGNQKWQLYCLEQFLNMYEPIC